MIKFLLILEWIIVLIWVLVFLYFIMTRTRAGRNSSIRLSNALSRILIRRH